MTIPKFDQLSGSESLPELIEMVAKLQKQVQWLMDGKLGDDNIRANSITAIRLDVEELSAISADMGKLTSGEIYGAYIATKEAAYPRAEMSSTDNLIAAYAAADKNARLVALDGSTSAPTLIFRDGSVGITSLIYVDNTLNELDIICTDNIQISALPAGDVKINGNNVTLNGVNVNSGLGSNMTFDTTTRNLKLYAPNGNTLATVNIP